MDQRDDQRTRTPFGTGNDTLHADVAARIAHIVGVPARPTEPGVRATVSVPVSAPDIDAIDVTTYLLDPPASPDDVARSERRARIVRVGSLVGCGILAVVLLVPMPGGRAAAPPEAPARNPIDGSTMPADRRTESAAGAAAAAPSAPTSAPLLPRRVDTAPTAKQLTTRRGDARSSPSSSTPASPRQVAAATVSRAPAARPTRPAAAPARPPAASTATPAPDPRPTPKPGASRAPASGADAVLVPLG